MVENITIYERNKLLIEYPGYRITGITQSVNGLIGDSDTSASSEPRPTGPTRTARNIKKYDNNTRLSNDNTSERPAYINGCSAFAVVINKDAENAEELENNPERYREVPILEDNPRVHEILDNKLYRVVSPKYKLDIPPDITGDNIHYNAYVQQHVYYLYDQFISKNRFSISDGLIPMYFDRDSDGKKTSHGPFKKLNRYSSYNKKIYCPDITESIYNNQKSIKTNSTNELESNSESDNIRGTNNNTSNSPYEESYEELYEYRKFASLHMSFYFAFLFLADFKKVTVHSVFISIKGTNLKYDLYYSGDPPYLFKKILPEMYNHTRTIAMNRARTYSKSIKNRKNKRK